MQALPGVQPDTAPYPPTPSTHPQPSLKFSLQGGLPSQAETTVDGISAQNQTNNNIQGDAFPSAEAISEIRVDGVNNNAEYGQPGEITTITKSGTNAFHGSAYEYLQNQFLDATPYGTNAANKPHKVANDFGGSFGGPVIIPHLYNGRDKTFFFGDYEGLQYPQSTVLQALVPTALMRQGNFSQEVTAPLTNPFTGGTYLNNTVPISPVSANFLQFYPMPSPQFANLSLQQAVASPGYNYLSTRPDSITSNQFDVRGDQTFKQRASAFARYTWKNSDQLQLQDLALPNSTSYAQYRILASSFNYNFSPNLVNEFRFGFTLERDGNSNPFNGPAFTDNLGLNGITPAFYNGLPHLNFSQIYSIGYRMSFEERSRVFQFTDNLTWQVRAHSIKFGTDIRHLVAHTEAGGSTPAGNYGNFFFNSGTGTSATGQEFADFLVGVPYQSQTETITADNNATANAYVLRPGRMEGNPQPEPEFRPSLRVSPGPGLHQWTGGQLRSFGPTVGKTDLSDGYASTLSVQELANVNACSTAGVNNPTLPMHRQMGHLHTCSFESQAGLPGGLRNAPTLRFEPASALPIARSETTARQSVAESAITTSPLPGPFFTLWSKPCNRTSNLHQCLCGYRTGLRFPNTRRMAAPLSHLSAASTLCFSRHELARPLFAAERPIHRP